MKNITKWFKKSMHLSLALLVTAVLGIGLTVAFFTDTEGAINRARVGEISVTTQENVDDLTKSNIGVIANGTSEAYVRMRLDIPTVTYTYKDGEELVEGAQAIIQTVDFVDSMGVLTATDWASASVLGAVITRSDGTQEEGIWTKEEDGFWYLDQTLKQGDSAEIVKSITYPGLWDEEKDKLVDPLPVGITADMLTITITSEAVQVIQGVTGAKNTFDTVEATN